MNAFRSRLHVSLGNCDGIVPVDRRLVVSPLRETDRLAAQDVDCGEYDYR